MIQLELSIRQCQEQFKTGAFNSPVGYTQAGCLKKIAKSKRKICFKKDVPFYHKVPEGCCGESGPSLESHFLCPPEREESIPAEINSKEERTLYKRICCALLSLCLTLGLMPVGRAAEPTVFQDISPGDWYYDSVSCVYENGLMNGTGEGRFTPGASLTRGMFIRGTWRSCWRSPTPLSKGPLS